FSSESTNVNTGSPAKQKYPEGSGLLAKEKERARQTKSYHQDTIQPQTLQMLHCQIKQNEREIVDVDLQEQNISRETAGMSPKTPAGLDILSPSSTEPSGSRMDSR